MNAGTVTVELIHHMEDELTAKLERAKQLDRTRCVA